MPGGGWFEQAGLGLDDDPDGRSKHQDMTPCGLRFREVRGTESGMEKPRPRDTPADLGFLGGRDRRRSGDLALFRRALYQLSYPTSGPEGTERT